MKLTSPEVFALLTGLVVTTPACHDNKPSPAALEAGATYVQALTSICHDTFPNESTDGTIAVQGIREQACQVLEAMAELRQSCQESGYSFLRHHQEIANTDSNLRVSAEKTMNADIDAGVKKEIDRILGMNAFRGSCGSAKEAVFAAEVKSSSQDTPTSFDLRPAAAAAAVAVYGLWQ